MSRWLHHWPAPAGLLFALAIAWGTPDAGLAGVLAAAVAVYAASAAFDSRRSAWPWFFATGFVIATDRITDGALNATYVLLAAAVAALVTGVARRLRGAPVHPSLLRVQIPAVAAFGTLTVAGILVAPRLGAVLVAAGLLGHAVWDYAHHRAGQVVSRSLALFCLVLDATLAVLILVFAF